ncbi:unnamed protein product, partial [Effrenium voratum]
ESMPSSSAPHSFNKHGHSQLIEWIVRALKRLPHEMQACLQRYHLHAESKEPLKVGTACSGTDSPVLVARAYAEAVRQLWGANREVEHVFSCERNAKKRHFLANMFCNTFDSSHAMGSLYEDAVDLQFGPEGMSLDVLSDNISEVGTCCDLWAGFPCQDVSKLNPAAGQNRSVIKDSAKRTGAVFNYVLRYFAKVSDPGRALLLENVLGLLDRPPGINPELAGHLMTCLADPITRDLDDFLLPDTHQLLQDDFEKARTSYIKRSASAAKGHAKAKAKAKAKAASKWPEVHARLCERLGIDWWESGVPSQEVLDTHPGLLRLTDRQFDLLRLLGIRFPDSRKCCIELSQNLRSPTSVRRLKDNHTDIVTPHGQQLVAHRARCLLGYEALLLQGIHYGKEQFKIELGDFPDELLRDLAGNAFNAHCAAATYIVRQCIAAHLWQVSRDVAAASEDPANDLCVFDD